MAGIRRPAAKSARRGLLWLTAAMATSATEPSIGLAVGLGNPGSRYARTRHNVGVMVLDELARRLDAGKPVSRFAGTYREARGPGGPLGLLVPETYMNDSGRSVGPAAGSLRLAPEQVLVIHDEIDLPFGVVRGKRGGGSGGHNGLRSVEHGLGSREFLRIRVGIGGDSFEWLLPPGLYVVAAQSLHVYGLPNAVLNVQHVQAMASPTDAPPTLVPVIP